MNNRDHRKIMVIDGHTCFTGGINLADEYINIIRLMAIGKTMRSC
jgi:cardiolipin synthase